MNDSQSGDMDGTEDNSDGSSGGGSTPSSNGSGSGESGTQFKDKESTPASNKLLRELVVKSVRQLLNTVNMYLMLDGSQEQPRLL